MLSGGAGRAQDQRKPFTSGVALVTTDVVVRDKSGQFISDLKIGDFEVLEDGIRQTLVSFCGPRHPVNALRTGLGLIEGLGVRAALGRTLAAPDFRRSSDRVALMGYALWRDHYGSDPSILGRQIRTEQETGGRVESFQIVGVLPLDFYFGRDSSARTDLVLRHQLFAVGPSDPITLAATSLLLAGAGVLATWWPARRASRANPVMSLKES